MNIAKTAALRIAGAKSFAPADIAEWRDGWRIVSGGWDRTVRDWDATPIE